MSNCTSTLSRELPLTFLITIVDSSCKILKVVGIRNYWLFLSITIIILGIYWPYRFFFFFYYWKFVFGWIVRSLLFLFLKCYSFYISLACEKWYSLIWTILFIIIFANFTSSLIDLILHQIANICYNVLITRNCGYNLQLL